jgi:hypothetical protein
MLRHMPPSDALLTARSTLAARYVRVLVWCMACRHRRDADLEALIAASRSRGDRPPARRRNRVPARPPVSGRQPALGCITGHRKRSGCARQPASFTPPSHAIREIFMTPGLRRRHRPAAAVNRRPVCSRRSQRLATDSRWRTAAEARAGGIAAPRRDCRQPAARRLWLPSC